jgi:hypothetical protein
MRGKSDENWRVGQRCLADGDMNAAASRLYYAVFQVVYGYALQHRGYRYDGSGGVHADMARVVDSEINDKRGSGQVYRKLKGLRETADYDREPADHLVLTEVWPKAERIRNIFIKKNDEK